MPFKEPSHEDCHWTLSALPRGSYIHTYIHTSIHTYMALLTHPVSTYYCRDYLSAGKLASVVGNARKPSPSGYVYVHM